MKKSDDTARLVLYEALDQCIRPLEESIIDQHNKIYNLSQREIDECKNDKYFLSSLLEYAADVVFEIEYKDMEKELEND